MSRFNECLKIIKSFDDNAIRQSTYDRYRQSFGQPSQPVRFITEVEESEIYLSFYFRPARCILLPEPVDIVMFDTWIQHRPDTSAKILQSALGVDETGIIDMRTMSQLCAMVDTHGPFLIATTIIKRREELYLMGRDADQSLRRMSLLMEKIA